MAQYTVHNKDNTIYIIKRKNVLRFSTETVRLPILTTWGLLVRKSRIQLQRAVKPQDPELRNNLSGHNSVECWAVIYK